MNPHFAPEIFSSQSQFEVDQLTIAGCSARDLVTTYGSPLFVVDESDFRSRALSWKSALEDSFPNHAGMVFYAAKSFISVEIAKWISEIEIGLDVCTGGELAVALAANFPPDRIEVHGNNKSEAELLKAIDVGVRTIVIDSVIEIERVARLALEKGKIQKVFLRLTAGVEVHTHEFIATAHEDVKFGFSIASGAAWKAVEAVESHTSLKLIGFHSHIGSQIFGVEGFAIAATRVIELLAKYRDHFDRQLPELNLGGGYGIAYMPGEETVDPRKILGEIAIVVNSACANHALRVPLISIEPGRAIVGPTTTTLYLVGTTKSVELADGLTRRYIAVDGGMSENIRPALYGADYYAILANRESTTDLVASRIVGKHCETGDILIKDIDLASDISAGDIIAVPATGAYCRSMASNYNHVPKPAVVAVKDGKAKLILRRETELDLLALESAESYGAI